MEEVKKFFDQIPNELTKHINAVFAVAYLVLFLLMRFAPGVSVAKLFEGSFGNIIGLLGILLLILATALVPYVKGSVKKCCNFAIIGFTCYIAVMFFYWAALNIIWAVVAVAWGFFTYYKGEGCTCQK